MGFSDALSDLVSGNDNGQARGVVTAVREDGLLNVRVNGGMAYGVPAITSYSSRTPGDVVQLVHSAGTWIVVGKFGADTAFVGPTTQPLDSQAYTVGTNVPNSNYTGSEVGMSPNYPGPSVLLALSYYNGSANVLSTGASGKTNVYVYVSRSVYAVDPSPVALRLLAHNVNALPKASALMLYDVSAFTEVDFTLEVGERKMIKLPSDWVSAIVAATPTIKGFAIAPNPTITQAVSRYTLLSPTAGAFRAV